MALLARPRVWTLLTSAAMTTVGVLWLVAPGTYPYGAADRVRVSVTHLVEHGTAGALLVGFGLLGVLVSVAAGSARPAVARVVAAGAVLQAVFFGPVMSDAAFLSSLGYACAVVAPLAVLVAVTLACVRRSRAGYVAAAVLAVLLVVAVGTGAAAEAGTVVRNITAGFASYGTRIAWTWAMAGTAALWTWLAVRTARALRSGTPASASVTRWGSAVTVLAAACPLPYGVVRLTWLTPWPVGVPGEEVDLATRLQGAALGTGAVLGAVLTLGLVARWGERFPSWLPALAGRPVPVALAVVPGTVVATAVLLATPGLVTHFLVEEVALLTPLEAVVTLPILLWGPLLAAAVAAYWMRRRAPAVLAG